MDKVLLQLFLPEGLLDYFELKSTEQKSYQYIFYQEEKNIPPIGYSKEELESKGFYNEESVRDFPLCGRPSNLKIKRREWIHKMNKKRIKID